MATYYARLTKAFHIPPEALKAEYYAPAAAPIAALLNFQCPVQNRHVIDYRRVCSSESVLGENASEPVTVDASDGIASIRATYYPDGSATVFIDHNNADDDATVAQHFALALKQLHIPYVLTLAESASKNPAHAVFHDNRIPNQLMHRIEPLDPLSEEPWWYHCSSDGVYDRMLGSGLSALAYNNAGSERPSEINTAIDNFLKGHEGAGMHSITTQENVLNVCDQLARAKLGQGNAPRPFAQSNVPVLDGQRPAPPAVNGQPENTLAEDPVGLREAGVPAEQAREIELTQQGRCIGTGTAEEWAFVLPRAAQLDPQAFRGVNIEQMTRAVIEEGTIQGEVTPAIASAIARAGSEANRLVRDGQPLRLQNANAPAIGRQAGALRGPGM